MLNINNNIKNKKNNLINSQEFSFTSEILNQIIIATNRYDAHMSKIIEISLEKYFKLDMTQDIVDWVYQDIIMPIERTYLKLELIKNLEVNKNKSILIEKAISALYSLRAKWFFEEKDKNGKDLEYSRFFRLVISNTKKILLKK